jgi:multidrug efflux pump subunit AcrA (membrane-fusion protein)
LAALVFGLINPPGTDSLAVHTNPAVHTEESERSSSLLGDTAAQNQQLADLQRALQQERDKSEKLAGELVTTLRELRSQTAALAKSAAQQQELTDLRQVLQQTERLAATNQALLAQERARTRGLEEQLTARQDATPAPAHNVVVSLPQTPDPMPAPVTDKPATAPLPTSDKPTMPAVEWPAMMAAGPTAPGAPGNPEPARLMARASLLLGQGNIGVARVVLERAAEMGSAPALFALAETYDPAVLSAWGTFGTQGDVGKARELYAKAFVGGVREAKDRLNASR